MNSETFLCQNSWSCGERAARPRVLTEKNSWSCESQFPRKTQNSQNPNNTLDTGATRSQDVTRSIAALCRIAERGKYWHCARLLARARSHLSRHRCRGYLSRFAARIAHATCSRVLSRQKQSHLTVHFLLTVTAIAASAVASVTVSSTLASVLAALFEGRKAAEQLVKLFPREAAASRLSQLVVSSAARETLGSATAIRAARAVARRSPAAAADATPATFTCPASSTSSASSSSELSTPPLSPATPSEPAYTSSHPSQAPPHSPSHSPSPSSGSSSSSPPKISRAGPACKPASWLAAAAASGFCPSDARQEDSTSPHQSTCSGRPATPRSCEDRTHTPPRCWASSHSFRLAAPRAGVWYSASIRRCSDPHPRRNARQKPRSVAWENICREKAGVWELGCDLGRSFGGPRETFRLLPEVAVCGSSRVSCGYTNT
eukprot:scaffold5098_cov56-Phaeocystis_antarctica.AAC.3